MAEQPELGRVTVSVEPTFVSAAFVGEADEWNSRQLTERVPVGAHRTVLVDLSGVTFCSSAFLRALIELQNKALADGGRFRLTAVSPVVARVLEITALTTVLGGDPTDD